MFLVVLCLLALNITGSKVLMFVVGALVVLGLAGMATHGRKDSIEYELGADALLLRRGAEEESLLLENVVDANLIDLGTARGYVRQHRADDVGAGQHTTGGPGRISTRYCGVPITTWGLGSMVNGLSNLNSDSFSQSLVLLRIRDGGVLLLSPRYSERMVRAIGKAKGLDTGTAPNV